MDRMPKLIHDLINQISEAQGFVELATDHVDKEDGKRALFEAQKAMRKAVRTLQLIGKIISSQESSE